MEEDEGLRLYVAGGAPNNDRVDMLKNPALAFGASTPLSARRAVVKTDNCNKCHAELTRHEGVRLAKSVEQRLKKLTTDKPWLVQQASAGTTAVPGTPRPNGQAPTREALVEEAKQKLMSSGAYTRY